MKRITLVGCILVVVSLLLMGCAQNIGGEAVKKVSTPSAVKCIDPDNTYSPNAKENIKSFNKNSSLTKTTVLGKTDYCISNASVSEAYCADKATVAFAPIACPKGCLGGACVNGTTAAKPAVNATTTNTTTTICTPGWKQKDIMNDSMNCGHQKADCSWEFSYYCAYGCSSTGCYNPPQNTTNTTNTTG